MRTKFTLIVLLLMLSVSALSQFTAVPQLMNLQGRLTKPDGTPVPDGTHSVRFSLWTAASGGTEKWNQTVNVAIRNGTFAAQLDTSTGAADKFNHSLFLEIKIGTDAPLTPRQPLASVAYAMKADSVKNSAITSASIANGTITADDIAPTGLNSLSWLLAGNTSPAPDSFLGTLTDFPLELRVNNSRAMEYRYAERTDFQYRSINVLGGSSVNEIVFGTVGATIAGGGSDHFASGDEPNRVTADFGTIGGGLRNNVTNSAGVVGGGLDNNVTGAYSVVGGGQTNTAGGQYATVGGGYFNRAMGTGSTVPGGFRVSAGGSTAFAAGYRANASHTGSFVWGDQTEQDLFSTGSNQFIIRATNGVGINTNNPGGYTFNVNGSLRASSISVSGNQIVSGSQTVSGNHIVSGNQTVNGTLVIRNVLFGDYRNVQWNSSTGRIYYDNSSRKHKENITPLQDDFDKLLQAVPMTYTRPGAPNRWEIGFIAEDFHDLGLKRLVDYSDQGEVEGINYEKICLYLTAIARKQNDRLNDQQKQREADKRENEAKLKQKDTEIAELRTKLDSVLERLERLEAERK